MSSSPLTTPLTRDQATRLADAVSEREDLALTASAYEDSATGEWMFEATTQNLPDLLAFEALTREVLGGDVGFTITPIDPEVNWVARSLDGLKPVISGGVYVYGAHDSARPPAGLIPIHIDAAQAFGTGHHETTTGCLEAIASVIRRRRPHRILDVGTGTGILAIAVAKRIHRRVIASDIDPVATRTAAGNARANGAGPFLRCVTATGLAHPSIRQGGPYDLIVANILAAPLVALAPAIARNTRRGCVVILSGLLVTQAPRVITAYARQGIVLRRKLERGDWATLLLERPDGHHESKSPERGPGDRETSCMGWRSAGPLRDRPDQQEFVAAGHLARGLAAEGKHALSRLVKIRPDQGSRHFGL